MDLEKFKDLIEINERKKAITYRHDCFEKIRVIMSNNNLNIARGVAEISNFLGSTDKNFAFIFRDYLYLMLQQENDDFIEQSKQIEKEIEEA